MIQQICVSHEPGNLMNDLYGAPLHSARTYATPRGPNIKQ